MKFRIFQGVWTSVAQTPPKHISSRVDCEMHIRTVVNAGHLIGHPRMAIGEDGFFYGVDADKKPISRAKAMEMGTSASHEELLLNTTILIHPGENQCRVYLIPYPMRPGQSPSDLKLENQNDWIEVGRLNHKLELIYLAKLLQPFKDMIEGQGGGTHFTFTPHDFGLSSDYKFNETGMFEYDIYRRNGDHYVGRAEIAEEGGWRVMPAYGSFDTGGILCDSATCLFNPFHRRGFPARRAHSFSAAMEMIHTVDSQWNVAQGGRSLIAKEVDAHFVVAELAMVNNARERAFSVLSSALGPKIDAADLTCLDLCVQRRVVNELWMRCGTDAKAMLVKHPNTEIAERVKAHLALDEEDKMAFLHPGP